MTRSLVFVLACLACSFSLKAQNVDSLWAASNEQYAAGQYREALDGYLQIEKLGQEHSSLYYNMGNAYYKLRYVAQAILYYERALGLSPNDPDIAYNLAIAQESCVDKIEPVPTFFLITWIKQVRQAFSSDAWAWACLLLVAVALAWLLLFYFGRHRGLRKTAFVLAVFFLLFALTAGLFSWSSRYQATRHDAAIVFNAVTSVKSSPDENGKDLLVIHEGTKVLVMEEMGKWAKIELLDGRQGWIGLDEIVFVY